MNCANKSKKPVTPASKKLIKWSKLPDETWLRLLYACQLDKTMTVRRAMRVVGVAIRIAHKMLRKIKYYWPHLLPKGCLDKITPMP
jgi:hypothetical protein